LPFDNAVVMQEVLAAVPPESATFPLRADVLAGYVRDPAIVTALVEGRIDCS
jgi:hypothetical protein